MIMVLLPSILLGKNHIEKIKVIPEPKSVKVLNGSFRLSSDCKIKISTTSLTALSDYLNSQIKHHFKVDVASNRQSKNCIELIITSKSKLDTEAYELRIERNKVQIIASGNEGVFYGIQSLMQIGCSQFEDNQNVIDLPCCVIKDKPRFSWRGFMLDESRHFFGKEKVKQLIDLMAFHKLNRFHWHLTDAPGWRIEIKKYPKLTSVGGKGCHSNPDAPVTFYTQEEISEIIEYAKERFIVIIPEIDMPGHATAAVKAYPEYSGGGSKKHPEFTFNPGKEETYNFLEDILLEVAELFPSEWMHIGMDEVHFGNKQWATLPDVKQLMVQNDIKDLKGVEKYFAHRMDSIVKSMGKITTGWDEIVEHQLPSNKTLIMWWRHDKPEIMTEALKREYKTVLCPRIPCYLDFVQHDSHTIGRRWKGDFVTLEKVYEYPILSNKIKRKQVKNIVGLQANMWTEQIKNEKQLDYMIFPRLSAFAESAWTKTKNKSYDNFIDKMSWMYRFYRSQGLYYFNIIDPDKSPEFVDQRVNR